jgi:hypothetical protein
MLLCNSNSFKAEYGMRSVKLAAMERAIGSYLSPGKYSAQKSGVAGVQELQNGTAAFRLWMVIDPLPCGEEFGSASLHRSQILRDFWAMQAQAAESSGYAGEFRCFLKRKI